MESNNPKVFSVQPPPKAIQALISGFNAIAGNVFVILIPAAVDLFLWLGPRLKADVLLAPVMDIMPQIQSQLPADQAQILSQFFTDFRNGINLFSTFRTYPLGVFSLMSTNLSENAPYGLRGAYSVPNWFFAFGLMLLLTLLGWITGGIYFRAVSRVAIKLQNGPGLFRTMLHSVLLSIGWMALFVILNLPLMIGFGLLALLPSILRTILAILLSVIVAWGLLVVYYSFYSIYTRGQNIIGSIQTIFRVLRYGLPPLAWFSLLCIIISQGMDLLWRAAPPKSWMTGVGIFGHAFISTSLLAASFIYYHDLNLWIESALQWFKQNKSSVQA